VTSTASSTHKRRVAIGARGPWPRVWLSLSWRAERGAAAAVVAERRLRPAEEEEEEGWRRWEGKA